MSRLSSLADAEHTIEWQVNLTYVLLLLLVGYVVWKTDILDSGEQAEEQGNSVEVALEDPA